MRFEPIFLTPNSELLSFSFTYKTEEKKIGFYHLTAGKINKFLTIVPLRIIFTLTREDFSQIMFNSGS